MKSDPEKIKAITNMPTPLNIKQLKTFLGMVNYLAKFLPNISTITEPLRQLDRKETPWHWDSAQNEAFEKVKNLVTSPPVLQYFNPKEDVKI